MLRLWGIKPLLDDDMQVLCTECGGKAVIHSRKQQTNEVADLYCSCRDPLCGHTFKMTLAFSHTISPSAKTSKKMLADLIASLPRNEQVLLFEQAQLRH